MTTVRFDSKAPAAGITTSEGLDFYKTLGRERYALVCIESIERTTKLDFDADNVVKLRVTAIEIPDDADGQAAVKAFMEETYAARTAGGTLFEPDAGEADQAALPPTPLALGAGADEPCIDCEGGGEVLDEDGRCPACIAANDDIVAAEVVGDSLAPGEISVKVEPDGAIIVGLPRGICPVCKRDVALRNNGAAREHTVPDGFGSKCRGSGEQAAS